MNIKTFLRTPLFFVFFCVTYPQPQRCNKKLKKIIRQKERRGFTFQVSNNDLRIYYVCIYVHIIYDGGYQSNGLNKKRNGCVRFTSLQCLYIYIYVYKVCQYQSFYCIYYMIQEIFTLFV